MEEESCESFSESQYTSNSQEQDSQESDLSDESAFSTCSSSSEEQIDTKNIEWKNYNRNNKLNNIFPEFEEIVGVRKDLNLISQPIDAFQLFFDDKFYLYISKCIDNYYKQNVEDHKAKSHHKRYEMPTINEIKVFFAILIFMGINKMPSIRMYWSPHNIFASQIFKKLMTMERFYQLRSCMSFRWRSKTKERDPTQKVQPLVNILVEKFQNVYNPQINLTIDETMIKFNGRSKLKVYMPLKPIKYGFKGYVLCEADSGYVLNWVLYNGKKNNLIDIVDNLVNNYKNKGYILSYDRFYSSIDVIEHLSKQGFQVFCATMKTRIKLTQEMKEETENLAKFESKFYISNQKNLILTAWRDTKLLYLLSNSGDNSEIKIQRTIENNKKSVSCPQNISYYSKTSHGVDFMDQMISYYNPDLRSKKWYLRILNHLLSITIFNSYIIFNKKNPKSKISLLNYQIEIIFSLIKEKIKENEQQNQKPLNQIVISTKPCRLGKGFLRDCVVCTTINHKRKSTFICSTHNINICAIPCYDQHQNTCNSHCK